MAHDGTGTGWDITAPANGDQLRYGAQEIRDLRTGVGIRLSKEHTAFGTNSAGGDHVAGSAQGFYQSTQPLATPGAVALTGIHAGRIWTSSSDLAVRIYNGTNWFLPKLVDSIQLTDGILRTNHFTASVVGSDSLAAGSVVTTKIADTNVTTGKLADSCVATGKIADAAITNAKLASSVVTSDKIASGAVNTTNLADGAITVDKIAANAVTASKIVAGTITSREISSTALGDGLQGGSGTVISAFVDDSTVGISLGKIAVKSGGIANTHLASNAVTGAKVAATYRVCYASYSGNGNIQGPTINVGFQPSLIQIYDRENSKSIYWSVFGQSTAWRSDGSTTYTNSIEYSSTGFQITSSNSNLNGNGKLYYVIAFG